MRTVPGAVVEGLRAEVVCPATLQLLWRPVDATLLGGPENEIVYVVTFTASGSQSRNQTFTYNSSLTVSQIKYFYKFLDLSGFWFGMQTFLLEDVVPFTNYTIQLVLRNENGTGVPSAEATVTSCDGPAPPPLRVVAENVSSTVVSVSWEAPPTVPGQLVGFVVRYRRHGQGEFASENTDRYV